MKLDSESCYQALLTHDTRFDGAFFVGVGTTKIYCRPVCPAKTPRRNSCTFYPSAASAEQAGFRPCLRCRPELAPGNARMDAISYLASAAAGRIEDGALTEGSVADLAAEMGISERHLRRILESEFGVSPIALAQTQRLLLAKRLLTDTRLPIGEIAFASGFSSLRRFNALFQERYRLKPTDVRRSGPSLSSPETIFCEIAYRPPLDWEAMLQFLRRRASDGIESIEENCYRRTVSLGKHRGWISVRPQSKKNVLCVEVSATLIPVLLPTLARVKRLFDLAAEPQQIASHLGPLAATNPGLRVPGAFDGFEVAVRTILGQQISVKAATTLAGRLASAFGEPIQTPYPQLTHLTPTAARLSQASPNKLTALGILAARAESLIALANAVTKKEISLEPSTDIEKTLVQLQTIPGIGAWTAQVIAMRVLSWPDAFPHTDLGLRRALGEKTATQILAIADTWRPWRSYATMHLWHSLEGLK